MMIYSVCMVFPYNKIFLKKYARLRERAFCNHIVIEAVGTYLSHPIAVNFFLTEV